MTLFIKPALAAAILIAASAGAFADTGRPTDYAAPNQPATVDRHADDAYARYQAVVDGTSRSVFEKNADANDFPAVDTYAKYLMVVDGMGRDAAIERARLRQASMAQTEERQLARVAR